MANFNREAILAITKQMKAERSGMGDILDVRKMDRDVPRTIRLLKPNPNQGGEWMYVVTGITYWINQKPYLSPATFKEECPIEAVIEKAKANNSPGVHDLLNDWRNFSKEVSYYMPIVPIEASVNNDTEEIEAIKVTGPERVLKSTAPMFDNITDIIVNPTVQPGTDGQGVFHPTKGYAIQLLKTGKGKETKYTATLTPIRIPIPEDKLEPYDIMGYFNKLRKPDAELEAAITTYLYGDSSTEDLDDVVDLDNKELAGLSLEESLDDN